MTLFFVGVVEMAVAASWTRYVTKANVVMTGLVTYVNIFIWYYVVEQVVKHIDNGHTIIPYAAGCALGSMLGAFDAKPMIARVKKSFGRSAKPQTAAMKQAVPAYKPGGQP